MREMYVTKKAIHVPYFHALKNGDNVLSFGIILTIIDKYLHKYFNFIL